MKTWKARSGRMVEAVPSRTAATDPPRAARCKAMFAELSSYLDEQLDDSLCEELEQHLNGCEPCKAFLSSLASTIAQCRRLPAECPTGKEAVRLRGQLLKNYEQVRAVVRPGQ